MAGPISAGTGKSNASVRKGVQKPNAVRRPMGSGGARQVVVGGSSKGKGKSPSLSGPISAGTGKSNASIRKDIQKADSVRRPMGKNGARQVVVGGKRKGGGGGAE